MPNAAPPVPLDGTGELWYERVNENRDAERKKREPMKLKKRDIIIIAILAVVIIVAGVVLFLILREYSSGKKVYDDFEKYVFLPEETSAPQQPGSTGKPDAAQKEDKTDNNPGEASAPLIDARPPVVDFEGLQKKNSDIIGWIYSAGTPVNYPVVQGETNDEYLYRTANLTNNRCGSIFLDCQNERSFEDSNNVIHGHNMQNGSMFAELMKYTDQKYYDQHPWMWLVTPEQTYSIELFAGFVTSLDSDVWKLTFPTSEDFTSWKTEMAKKSYFQSSVVPLEGEKVITLSTCTNDDDSVRFVVMGVLR